MGASLRPPRWLLNDPPGNAGAFSLRFVFLLKRWRSLRPYPCQPLPSVRDNRIPSVISCYVGSPGPRRPEQRGGPGRANRHPLITAPVSILPGSRVLCGFLLGPSWDVGGGGGGGLGPCEGVTMGRSWPGIVGRELRLLDWADGKVMPTWERQEPEIT